MPKTASARDPSSTALPSSIFRETATFAFSVVVTATCGEYLVRAAFGARNEWPPIAAAGAALALAAAAMVILLSPLGRPRLALALGLYPALAPFARSALFEIGLYDWATGAAFVVAVPATVIVAWLASFRGLRRASALVAAFAAVGFTAHGYGALPGRRLPVDPSAPDVVLIVLDTTRSDHLSLYGYEKTTTPRLDALARSAVVYENAWSVSPWTTPSHASMFTGVLPAVHGVDGGVAALPEHLPTLAGSFAASGYRTAAFVANPNLVGPGWDRGFDVQRAAWFLGDHSITFLMNWIFRSADGPAFEGATAQIVDDATRWWEDNSDGARFLFINVMDPHFPYRPPDEYYGHYLEDVEPEAAYSVNQSASYRHLHPGLTPFEARVIRGLYDGEIESIDHSVGRLFDRLADRDELDDTVVAVTSDHGERLGERGLLGHFLDMDPFLLRVPLLIRYPSRLESGRVEGAVQLDGLPGYLLALVGIDAPATMAASALHTRRYPAIVAQQKAPIQWLPLLRQHQADFDTYPFQHDSVFVSDGHFALVRHDEEEESSWKLYSLAEDPELSEDVSARFPEVVERLNAVAAGLPRFKRTAGDEVDSVQLERLRALGYVR